MECGGSIVCGSGDLDLDPDIVSEEAGKLYSELQTVIEVHGAGVVESLVPILVWVLEGLASCRAQLRDREEEAEREKGEREELFDRYQSEKLLRRESQERYLELDDQIEQERRTNRGREKERERREKDLEKKAREQADQLVSLEEQRAGLGRELNTLKHTHNKLVLSYKDLLDKKKDLEREGSPLRNHVPSKHSGGPSTQGPAVSCVRRMEQTDLRPETSLDSAMLEESVTNDHNVMDIVLKPDKDPSFINDIISSTPELAQFHGLVESSTPARADAKEPIGDGPKTSLEEQIKEEEKGGEEEEEGGEEKEDDDDDEDMDCLELELRNTESVFSELSELSREYVESVDRGAGVQGSADQVEEILSQYEELKHTHELVDAARKALISRVEELTNERSALKLELTSCQETTTRFEGRMKEMEEETKRLRKELEANQSDEDSSLRRFSRSEMARVVMEKNQYKERLFELQEAVRRSQTLRATQEERVTEKERTSVWKRFNRLFGLNKDPLVTSSSLAPDLPTSPSLLHSPLVSPRKQTVSHTLTECASPVAALSPRVRRRELYREIRSHVWGVLGKRQIHGWSLPLSSTQESSEPTPEPKDVPVLVQLRLLDQRDATAKLTCAVAVPAEISGEATCAVWVISGPASSSDITVIDPARSNTVLDQFSLPPTSPALCICAVPPTGETSGTVWIGTQEGSVLVHSASTARRRCLQSVSLSESVHSLTSVLYLPSLNIGNMSSFVLANVNPKCLISLMSKPFRYSQGHVIAGLANGTLAFFSHDTDGWDLQSHDVMPLGSTPLQPIRCCLAKGDALWVGYWNRVHVVDLENRKVKQTVTVSERSEQQVRFLCAAGSGVWTSCRLDPTLRLFDWSTGRQLQEVDLTPLVTKTLGQAFLSLSPLQISFLTIISTRLWVGTGSGAIFSIPVSLSSETASIPYCSLATAQLCYHGHRQAVKVIIAAPGCVTSSVTSGGGSATLVSTSMLILSGGEGYINFRIGDDANDGAPEASPLRSDRSHMIIWQSPTPSVPSSAL